MAKASNKKAAEKVSQKEAEKMIESGEAEIPSEAIVQESSLQKSDLQNHPKFDKFKQGEK